MNPRYHRRTALNSRALAPLLLAWGLACRSPAPCPAGTRADVARADDLLALLRRTDAGRTATAVDDATICFGGATRGAVRPGRIVVLAESLPRERAAARLAHLLAHVADGLDRFPTPDVACEPQIEAALAAEARGIVAELAAWDALGRAGDPPYSFAAAALAASPAERPALVLARLRGASAEPTDELHALVRDYHDRCAGPHGR